VFMDLENVLRLKSIVLTQRTTVVNECLHSTN